MSRAALWRQEGGVKEREQRAEEVFIEACEEGRKRQRTKGVLPLWGPDDSFHINPLLLQNTIKSPYFQKSCQNLSDWNAVIDEIYYQVKNLQPFQTANSKMPSTAFCLLLRLLTMRMTEHQMKLTLDHADSPYIRGIGFLYLRFAGPPDQVLRWIEPYLFDQGEIQVTVSGKPTTIGDFVRHLFSSRDYYGTPLPRFPLATEREIQVALLQADKIARRAQQHFDNKARMQYFSKLGNQVMALYGDDENPVTWYRAVIDRVLTRDEQTGFELKHPKYVVTFTEYGNTETVHLGEMDVLDGAWKRESQTAPKDLYDQVRRREQETVTAEKRGQWARGRPPTATDSLSSRRHTHLQDDAPRRPKPPPAARAREEQVAAAPSAPPPRKRTPEELVAIAEKKRKLMSKYG